MREFMLKCVEISVSEKLAFSDYKSFWWVSIGPEKIVFNIYAI